MIKNWTLNVKNKTINTAKNSLNLSIENIQSFLNFTAKKNRGTVQLLMNQLRFKRTFFMF